MALDFQIVIYFISLNLIFSFLLSTLLVPNLIKLGNFLNLYDNPESRKIHLKPIVFTGGLSILLSSFMTTIVNYLIINNFELSFVIEPKIIAIFLSSLVCFLIGLFDDIYKLSPWPRLFMQLIISSFVWSQGISLNEISILNNTYIIPDFLSYILTILWITAIVNSFNWIDGIDGLAAGLSIISLTSFLIIFLINNNLGYVLLMSTLIGSCSGYLKYNFYPAKLIMGDSGSYFLGFLIASFGLISTNGDISNLYLPVLIISIPIFDMVFVILKRVISKNSPFLPDQNHIHHRLLQAGFNERKISFYLYSSNLFSSIICLSIFFS